MKRILSLETSKQIGKKVRLQGWVNSRRDHGKIIFFDLRDRSTIVQVVGGKELKKIRPEDVVNVIGTVKKRPSHLVNPKIPTGKVEVEAEGVEILNASRDLPFPIDTDGYDIEEEVRLKYRYLDLRRSRLQKNLKVRSAYVQAAREYLFSRGFTEIETPLLTKSTPEGSRDFIVPSRLNPGKFYALPQSPQQYKQLLMTAGFERYFQIARCLRDEDLRANRGFEHTQIDIEMSFVTREEVMALVEEMTVIALQKVGAKIAKKPFPIITYQDAMKKYGADKFDLRSEKEKEQGLLSFAWVIDFPFFEKDQEGKWTFTHNPFSQPVSQEHEIWLLEKKNIGKIITSQYDLICNGEEVSGGSIRSHKAEVLNSVFEILGYNQQEILEKFGHMLEAFTLGTPPHGGCAQGFERLLMALLNEDYLREVQAFPQTARGRTAVMEAPSEVEQQQLDELNLKVVTKKNFTESVFEQITGLLKTARVAYKTYKHLPVYTSEEAAKARNTDIKQGAKALIMFADKKPVMLVISAANKIDNRLFKKSFGFKDLRMATPEDVKNLTGIEIGAIPPFGNLFNLPLYCDQKLSDNKEIVFNAGRHDRSISMGYESYEQIAKPVSGNFSK